MSVTHKTFWLDTWWPLLLILFGLMFVTFLDTFSPMSEDNPTYLSTPHAGQSQH